MALKVFIVEDESVIREGLRDNIPWQQYGFSLVGEASDGEMALPLIRKERPDVLITDIKMPFMDGLELSHIVKREMPDTKIIIISGYDDFEYAQQAINVGVEQYLLKPITRSMLQKALGEVHEKITAEDEKKKQILQIQDELHSMEQNFRRNFFERVFKGATPISEIYEDARKHNFDINAEAYNLVMTCVEEKSGDDTSGVSCQECEEELMRYLLRYPDRYVAFRWSINIYGVLIKGDENNIGNRITECFDGISDICSRYENDLNWYAADGETVTRFSKMKECYKSALQNFSRRFFVQGVHILSYGEEYAAGGMSTESVSEGDVQGKKALQKAIEYIDNNFTDEALNLNEAASAANVSASYLSALFGQEKGVTFVEYVTEKRIKKSKELLMMDDIRSGDVGAMVGYKNPQYFSFVFKKAEGMSPREYRAMKKKGKN